MKIANVKNKLAERIKELELNGFIFRPTRSFYTEIQIKQKRWGQIYRNERPATLEELAKVASFFKIPISSLIDYGEKPELSSQEVNN